MATPLSIHNLLEGGWRTILSIAGISIAVILIFMQLGFLGAVLDTAVVFYDNLKFDLVVRSPDYYHFCDANKFSKEFLNKIENVEGHSKKGERSLAVHFEGQGSTYSPTFILPSELKMEGYKLLASPTIYSGQKLKAGFSSCSALVVSAGVSKLLRLLRKL